MPTRIQKWGNSLGVRLPKKIAERLQLTEGSEVTLSENEQQIVIMKTEKEAKPFSKKDWKKFVLPQKGSKSNISEEIDDIVYGASR